MKRTLFILGLTLGLCPLWAAAQADPDGTLATEPEAMTETAPWTGLEGLLAEPDSSPGEEIPNTGWVNALGVDYRGTTEGFKATGNNDGVLWCATGSSNGFANARLHLPHGVTMRYFRLWGWDGRPTGDIQAKLYKSCLPDLGPADSTSISLLASVASSGSPGYFTVTTTLSPAPVVDAHTCTYFAEIHFDNCDDMEFLSVAKVRVQFQK